MSLKSLSILAGRGRGGETEDIPRIDLAPGDTLAVVGPTGSGKSELLSDIEQLADGDTPSGRRILLNGEVPDRMPLGLVATLSQRTNFVIDTDVSTFISTHAACMGKVAEDWPGTVLVLANTLCGEPIQRRDPLQGLSGGQTRALMIADIALISDAPVILLDELENAGIDKHAAIAALADRGKIILTATHDPVLVLMGRRRVVMRGGAMSRLHVLDASETAWQAHLSELDEVFQFARNILRGGERLPAKGLPCHT
ncbi:MAG: ATP-binding cassette domain-containing protein [Rhodospirillaceae bacterium]|nr:ATP-binding cassette domain-containing protein [Rhodospirillaceae bacterium]